MVFRKCQLQLAEMEALHAEGMLSEATLLHHPLQSALMYISERHLVTCSWRVASCSLLLASCLILGELVLVTCSCLKSFYDIYKILVFSIIKRCFVIHVSMGNVDAGTAEPGLRETDLYLYESTDVLRSLTAEPLVFLPEACFYSDRLNLADANL